MAGAIAGGLALTGVIVGGFYFLRSQGLFGRSGASTAVVPAPTATATPQAGPPGGTEPPATPGPLPTVFVPPPLPTLSFPTPPPTAPSAGSTPASGRTPTPTRTARSSPTPTPTRVPTATPTPPPSPTPTPLVRPDATVITRRFVKLNVSPDQARVFLNGRYLGVSDDWDDAGGGALLAFLVDGRYRLRFAHPGRKDSLVDVVVAASAGEDEVEIARSLEKGTPDGPTGPEGKVPRPGYRTASLARLDVEPRFATVSVDGRDMGPASRFYEQDMQFQELGVYDVRLAAPGFEPRTVRVVVSPSCGKDRAVIREKLRKR